MRTLFLAPTLFLTAPTPTALAAPEPFHVGVARVSVVTQVPFDVLVWYPTKAVEVPWQVGPFPIPASHNAAIASGSFAIVLLSHGGGVTGGSPLVLRELSADLARRGFVVVAPFHGEASLAVRPFQVHQALDAVLADPRFKLHVDPTRLGMLGFSLGGAVTLDLAGAIPNMAHFMSYCDSHPGDLMSCNQGPGGGRSRAARGSNPLPIQTPAPSPIPLKAIVLLDPFAVPFQRDELASVTTPVLLFRPDQSELPAEENALGLAAVLPRPPQYRAVPGGHFIFVDVCAPFLQSAAPEACRDPPSVDRAAIHLGIPAQIAKFFRDNL